MQFRFVHVTIYTKSADPYSVRLKAFLKNRNIAYEEKDASEADPSWSIPQVVVDGNSVGDLEAVSSAELRGCLHELFPAVEPKGFKQ